MHINTLSLNCVGALAALTFLLAFSLPAVVEGNLYPTFPIQDSTIWAGNSTIIRWKDDGKSPHLSGLGLLRVDLLWDNDSNLVSTLAVGINPQDLAARIRIEKYFGVDGSRYYIRFLASNVQQPIYTADFTIAGLTGSPSYRQSGRPGGHFNGHNGDSPQNQLNDQLGAEEVVVPTSTSSQTESTSTFTGATSTSAIVFSPNFATNAIASATPTVSQKGAGSARFQRPNERHGFNSMLGMMYLFWPFMMGIAMAL